MWEGCSWTKRRVVENGTGHYGMGEDRMVVELEYSEQSSTQLAFAVAFWFVCKVAEEKQMLVMLIPVEAEWKRNVSC
jgi:hypothetical protein